MKKFIAAIASLMVLTSVSAIAPLSVSADSVVAFEIGTVSTTGAVSDGKLVQEETVTVPVRVTENVGMTTFLLEFTQDSNIEIISFDSKKDDTEFTSGAFTKNVDALRVLWIDNSCSDVSLCGLLMNIQVKVPAGTPVGKYEVGFNESETQLTNVNFDSLEYTLTSGYIEVGGDSSSNPSSSPQTPATTQAPQPVVTQAPVTNAPEPVATQAPAATKAPTVSTAKPQAANPATDAAANIAESETGSETTLETTDETAITSSAASTDITSESIAESDVTANTSGSSAKPSNNNNNTANGNKNNTVTKTDKSPSTGATGVVIPSILLAASAVGVVAAASNKKKK